MIELIFVIVILGILASVAIPKLAATRDDAEVSKAMQNVATVVADLGSYYTAQGKMEDNISKMTNVELNGEDTSAKTAQMKVGTEDDCITFKIDTAAGDLNVTKKPSPSSNGCKGLTLSQTEYKFGGSGIVR